MLVTGKDVNPIIKASTKIQEALSLLNQVRWDQVEKEGGVVATLLREMIIEGLRRVSRLLGILLTP